MRALLTLAALWPGLIQAWQLGRWRGLALAIAFTAALNAALISTFVWPHWPLPSVPGLSATTAWVLVLGLWIIGLRGAWRDWRLICPARAKTSDPQLNDWFREAQTHYLRGHWIEAETLAVRILARQPADGEAKLLLAMIQRRTKRWPECRQTLTELLQAPSAAHWNWEIAAELKQLSELEAATTKTTVPSPPESQLKAA